jgi:hypothetical protein
MSTRVIYSILFYTLLSILIIVSKPAIMFDTNGNLRPFGVGTEKTIFPLGVYIVTVAVISYYIFCVIDLIFGVK